MATFGQKLREWIETVWVPSDERAMQIINECIEKATEKLVSETPDGEIRFALVNKNKLVNQANRKIGSSKSRYFVDNQVEKVFKARPFFCDYPNELYYPTTYYKEIYSINELGVYSKSIILFYAKNIIGKENVAKNLITFWFETEVFPDFEKETKGRSKDYLATTSHTELYFLSSIKRVLTEFGITLTNEEYGEIIAEICDKNDVKLVEFKNNNIKISL